MGLLNGIDPINWQGTAVMKTGQAKQIVLGKWRIHGNVTFEKNVNGTEFLNGVNITETSAALTKERVELNPVVEEKNVRKNYFSQKKKFDQINLIINETDTFKLKKTDFFMKQVCFLSSDILFFPTKTCLFCLPSG